jgi:hypothetical protein
VCTNPPKTLRVFFFFVYGFRFGVHVFSFS